MITRINTNITSLDPTTLVNSETGETILSEIGKDSRLVVKGISEHFTVSSKEYIIIDSKALSYVCRVLGKTDVDKIFRMGDMLMTTLNAIYNEGNKPHTLTSLSKALSISESEFKKIVSRLVSKSVLAYTVCTPPGYDLPTKVYMLNPTLIRKRKGFHEDLLLFFKDLSTEEGQKAVENTPKRKRGRQPAI
jgi:hypothetical protein